MFTDLGPGKRAALVGLGVTNRAVAEYLTHCGLVVTGFDQKPLDKLGGIGDDLQALGVKLIVGPDSFDHDLGDYDYIFVTPGIRPDIPMVAKAAAQGVVITNEIDLLLHSVPGLVIGITGSSGKTTTTSMIGHIIASAGLPVMVGGNIGDPLISRLPEMTPETKVVLELSSFQLMNVRKSPQISLITNITPNHLDYHSSMEEYITAKKHVFSLQEPSGCVVINADDQILTGLVSDAPGKVVAFSRQKAVGEGAFLDGEQLVLVSGGSKVPVIDKSDIPLRGAHNLENVLAAIVVANYCGIPPNIIRSAIQAFKPVEHRLEFVREISGVKYYNDSIATSPARAIAGLRSFSEPVILIAGGYDKKLPFDEFVKEMPGKVRHLVLLGVTAPTIAELVSGLPDGPGYTICPSLEVAVDTARKQASSGDVVLLSPACASFDMFSSYRERGRIFKELVNRL